MEAEVLRDTWAEFVHFLKTGTWWQRSLLLGFFLGLAFFVFWVRPLPAEIRERLDYTQRSIGVMFVDGSARFFDERYTLVLPDGRTEQWTRTRWKETLKEQFERHKSRGERTHRRTKHITFRWTGLRTLVQTVEVTGTLMGRGEVLRENVSQIDFTWEKKNAGWFITKMQIKPS